MTESTNIDKFIVISDLKSRGKKPVELNNYILIKDNEYVVMVLNENNKINAKELERFLSFSSKINKNSVIAVVDKYGDVTYYFLSEVRLNKK